jgi:tRNA pseudouridine55 synthase
MPKRYTATFLLGRSSPTDDTEGDVTTLPDAPRPSTAEIKGAATMLTGEIMQRPPDFSAVKVAGRRAYKLARAGKQVELRPRPVTVNRIDVVRYAHPELTLAIECGSGTYVRSLGRDLAESLGTSAVMSALVRTAIGGFRLEEECNVDALTSENIDQKLLPALTAVESLPRIALDDARLRRIRNGLSIELPEQSGADELAVVLPDGRLTAILRSRGDGVFGPKHNFGL